jgi:hypothetical protein
MAIDPNSPVESTAFNWVPEFAQGQVRDLRVRWALEEVGRRYEVRCLVLGEHKQPPHRARQPFGQVPTAYMARGVARPGFKKALADQLSGFADTPPPEASAWMGKQRQG